MGRAEHKKKDTTLLKPSQVLSKSVALYKLQGQITKLQSRAGKNNVNFCKIISKWRKGGGTGTSLENWKVPQSRPWRGKEVYVGSVISAVLPLIARWLPAGKDKYLLIQQ